MSGRFGNHINLSIFGESHGPAIGMCLDGVKPGVLLDLDAIQADMARRRPGGKYATKRKETDEFQFLSGIKDGKTTGAPIAAIIVNKDQKSGDYRPVEQAFRPGHADFSNYIKYRGFAEVSGGGHSSGRLTAPYVLAGSIVKQCMKEIRFAARLKSVGSVVDETALSLDTPVLLEETGLAVLSNTAAQDMIKEIEAARMSMDSIGGRVEAVAFGVPAGFGGPLFEGMEGSIAQAIFAIPGVKAVAFGAGDALSEMHGSQANDEFCTEMGKTTLRTNRCGGILGGITTGTPLSVIASLKPTPTIARSQRTVDREGHETTIAVGGRHDPCIAVRAVPVVEAALALSIYDRMREKEWI